MKTCSVLKQRGCATRELFGNRRVDSRKRDKEQMRPFDTGTELSCAVWDISAQFCPHQFAIGNKNTVKGGEEGGKEGGERGGRRGGRGERRGRNGRKEGAEGGERRGGRGERRGVRVNLGETGVRTSTRTPPALPSSPPQRPAPTATLALPHIGRYAHKHSSH